MVDRTKPIVPDWDTAVEYCIVALQDGNQIARDVAAGELRRMARVADTGALVLIAVQRIVDVAKSAIEVKEERTSRTRADAARKIEDAVPPLLKMMEDD